MLSVLDSKSNNKNFERKKFEFESKFNEVMFEMDMFNKANKTFKLNIIYETNYGFFAQIYNVTGLSLYELESKKGLLQENLKCLWIMQIVPFEDKANVKIVTSTIDSSVKYVVPDIKPWEVYLGLNFSLEPIKINVNEHQMFLLGGATGSGKSRFIFMMLLSWIMNFSPNEVELYLSDCVKNGFINFRNVKHVKMYASELEQLYLMILKIKGILQYRIDLLAKVREDGEATNIVEYNATQKDKLSYIYVLIDEFSVLMPLKSDRKEIKEMKQEIIDFLGILCKVGREEGIFCFQSVQKCTREELSPIIKSNSKVRLSFRANDRISSEVIMEDHSACGLADRIAVYSLSDGTNKDFLFSPTLETTDLNKMLKEHSNNQPIKPEDILINNSDKPIPAKKEGCFVIQTVNKNKVVSDKYIKKEDGLIDY